MRRFLSGATLCASLCLIQAFPAHADQQTLEQALALAYQNNPGLAAARAKLRAVDEQVPQALSGWHPSVSATVEDGKSRQHLAGNILVPTNRTLAPFNASVSVTQPVFSGFRTVAAVHSAEAGVKAEQAALQSAEEQLLFDAAKAYLDVVQAETVLGFVRENEASLQQEYAQTQDRLRMGELKKTDVAQAQSRLEAAKVERLNAEGDLLNQRTTFARIVGQMPGTLAPPQLGASLPAGEEDAVSRAEDHNPSVLAAVYTQKGAKADIAAARGNLLPELDIVGNAAHALDQGAFSPDQQDTAIVEARLTLPLYGGGGDYAKTRAAKQTAAQRRLELDDACAKAREFAANAWQALETARAATSGRVEVVTAEEDALRGVQTEYKFGTRTTLDVLNAEQELLDAKVSLARAQHDEQLAIIQLKAATGELTAGAMHLPVDIYDPDKHYHAVRNKWAGTSIAKE